MFPHILAHPVDPSMILRGGSAIINVFNVVVEKSVLCQYKHFSFAVSPSSWNSHSICPIIHPFVGKALPRFSHLNVSDYTPLISLPISPIVMFALPKSIPLCIVLSLSSSIWGHFWSSLYFTSVMIWVVVIYTPRRIALVLHIIQFHVLLCALYNIYFHFPRMFL